ncbi:MAG: hypothetical protein BGO99_01700 [Nitrosospira sp. 56-18]|nr:MAG: hypothetical protein BGO99_01700 [Nitrosospira sp. 56-18]
MAASRGASSYRTESAWQAIISIYPSADRRTDMILPASGWKRSRHFATLGLSQVNSINEQIKNRMNAAFGHDYNYTYLFPGMRNAYRRRAGPFAPRLTTASSI